MKQNIINVKHTIAGFVSLLFIIVRQNSIPPVGYITLDVFTASAALTKPLLFIAGY